MTKPATGFSNKFFHKTLDVEEAIKNWNGKHWRMYAKLNKVKKQEFKARLFQYVAQGNKFLLVSNTMNCLGFDPKTGCPGHEVSNG